MKKATERTNFDSELQAVMDRSRQDGKAKKSPSQGATSLEELVPTINIVEGEGYDPGAGHRKIKRYPTVRPDSTRRGTGTNEEEQQTD